MAGRIVAKHSNILMGGPATVDSRPNPPQSQRRRKRPTKKQSNLERNNYSKRTPIIFREDSITYSEYLEELENMLKLHQEKPEECVICQEEYSTDEGIVLLKCAHYFHESCIKEWSQRSTECPLCRRPINYET